jgi:broad specificity phosphatase PhoE
LLSDLRTGFDDARVWVFSHQAVIMSFRYVLDGLSEDQLMEIDRTSRVGNASLTTYRRPNGVLELQAFGDASIVDARAAEVTAEPTAREEASADA